MSDRYQALGIPYPDPETMCKGQWIVKRRYLIQQRLRCSRITGHFFNREPSPTCWFCHIHFPPKREPLVDDEGGGS